MKKIPLDQLLKESRAETYREQYQYVCGLIEKQQILPVKSSPLNGKKPALHQNYWLVEAVPDYEELIEELKFHMLPAIKTDYYLNHPDVYQEEKKWVRLLNRYFSEQNVGDMPVPAEMAGYVSLNERSFQIWGREKFLQREQGRKILAHCGVGIEQLQVYDTTEPLAYYSASRRIPQTILILENKDTFYSMRRHLMNHLWKKEELQGEKIQIEVNDTEKQSKTYGMVNCSDVYDKGSNCSDVYDKGSNCGDVYDKGNLSKIHDMENGSEQEGKKVQEELCDKRIMNDSCNKGRITWSGQIFGVEIGTLVYGAGKGILRSYEDFRFCVEPHINDPKNQILYFGDLDYEGIGIYERLTVLFDNKDGTFSNEDGAFNNKDATLDNEDATLNNEDAAFGIEAKTAGGRGAGHKVKPFIQAYEKMVEKAEACGVDFLPETSEKQNRNLSGIFFSYFSRQTADKMISILESGKYIPQEIINIMDF